MPTDLVQALSAAGPYAITITIIAGLIAGWLAPKWILDDLKARLKDQDDLIKRSADAQITLNGLLAQQRADSQTNQTMLLDAFNRLTDVLRDRRP